MKTLREYIDLIESATAPIIVPKRSKPKPKQEPAFSGLPNPADYRGPAAPQPEKKIPVRQDLKPMDHNLLPG